MKLPQFIEPKPFTIPSMTEPNQALSLREVVYRVSRGETTGIGRLPDEYGEDDGSDDPYLNGIEAESLEVAQIAMDLGRVKKRVDNRLKFLNSKTTKIVNKKESDSNDDTSA